MKPNRAGGVASWSRPGIWLFAVGALQHSSGCGGPSETRSLLPVEVAVVAPLTGDGTLLHAARAWTLVEEKINEAGGVGGRELKVRTFDTPLTRADDLTPVVDGFSLVVEQGFKFVVSLIAGDNVEPMMGAAMSNGVLAMSIVAEHQSFNRAEYDGMLLRAVLPTDQIINRQVEVMVARQERRVVLIGPEGAGTADPRHSSLMDAYSLCDDCEAFSVTYPDDADPYFYDWAGLGDRAMQFEPTAVYLTGVNTQALNDTIYMLERRGYSGRYYFAYGGYIADLVPDFWDTAAERFRAFDLALPETLGLSAFREAYTERFSAEISADPRLLATADYIGLLSVALQQVDSGNPEDVALAMKRISRAEGTKVGPLDFVRATRAIEKGEEVQFEGVSGPLRWNERGEIESALVVEYAVGEDGTLGRLVRP